MIKQQSGIKSQTSEKSHSPKNRNRAVTPQTPPPAAIVIQRAIRNPGTLSPHVLLHLQGTVGNRAIQRLLEQKDKTQSPLAIQRRTGGDEAPHSAPLPENQTGMPETLKTGVENLSGLAMDDVKVHYNSPKPATVQALAYTQGSNIYVGSGQEKHLPHEAWHVVQQKQGRVNATIQAKNGVAINTDARLEHEADRLGEKAANRQDLSQRTDLKAGQEAGGVMQGVFEVTDSTFPDFLKTQSELQSPGKDGVKVGAELGEKGTVEPFTTVGFEAEFAEHHGDSPLAGISHLELAESNIPPMNYTGLPFKLETDASDVIELVTPPFLIRTKPDAPIPHGGDIQELDKMLRGWLEKTVQTSANVEALVDNLQTGGLKFELANVKVGSEHLSHRNKGNYDKTTNVISKDRLSTLKVQKPSKGGGITTQVNFATDEATIAKMRKISGEGKGSDATGLVKALREPFATFERLITNSLTNALESQPQFAAHKPSVEKFIPYLARNISGQIAVRGQSKLKDWQEKLYQDKGEQTTSLNQNLPKSNMPSGQEMKLLGVMTSVVKDIDEIWVKDTLTNIAAGLYGSPNPANTNCLIILGWLCNQKRANEITKIQYAPDLKLNKGEGTQTTEKKYNWWLGKFVREGQALMPEALLNFGSWAKTKSIEMQKNVAIEPTEIVRPPFLHHDPTHITPRQDTLISNSKAQVEHWKEQGKMLHVVESRRASAEMMKKLWDEK